MPNNPQKQGKNNTFIDWRFVKQLMFFAMLLTVCFVFPQSMSSTTFSESIAAMMFYHSITKILQAQRLMHLSKTELFIFHIAAVYSLFMLNFKSFAIRYTSIILEPSAFIPVVFDFDKKINSIADYFHHMQLKFSSKNRAEVTTTLEYDSDLQDELEFIASEKHVANEITQIALNARLSNVKSYLIDSPEIRAYASFDKRTVHVFKGILQLSSKAQQAVFAHELAHLDRNWFDYLMALTSFTVPKYVKGLSFSTLLDVTLGNQSAIYPALAYFSVNFSACAIRQLEEERADRMGAHYLKEPRDMLAIKEIFDAAPKQPDHAFDPDNSKIMHIFYSLLTETRHHPTHEYRLNTIKDEVNKLRFRSK